MQFADIAINTKTASRDLFSYQIPAQQLPFIQEGSLVQVPFAGRKLLGVVFKLKKNLRKMEADQLKSIIKVVDPTPILDSNRLKLAQKIKDYYISPLGKVAFAMIPKPAYRLADKNQEKIINHPARFSIFPTKKISTDNYQSPTEKPANFNSSLWHQLFSPKRIREGLAGSQDLPYSSDYYRKISALARRAKGKD
jgi:primosomal protein N'